MAFFPAQKKDEQKDRKTKYSGRENLLLNHASSATAYKLPCDGYVQGVTKSGSDKGIIRLSSENSFPYITAMQFSGHMVSYVYYVTKGLDRLGRKALFTAGAVIVLCAFWQVFAVALPAFL